jgi:acetylornithine/succinyldiaminopimelate/putrescine aminotransferase
MATSAPSLSRLLIVIAQMIFHGRSARTMSITPEKTECHCPPISACGLQVR